MITAIGRLVIALAGLFSLLFLAVPHRTEAATGNLFISELMWQGSFLSSADEWVELQNNSTEFIDLAGYSIIAKSETGIELWSVSIPEGEVAPQSNFLLSNYPRGEDTIINTEPDIVNNDISLSNSKLRIELKDREGDVIDVAGDYKPPFFPDLSKIYKSMQRLEPVADGSLESSWTTSDEEKNLSQEAVDAGVLATPTSSGRPIISGLRLIEPAYQLDSVQNFELQYTIADTDDDFEKVLIYFSSGEPILLDIDQFSFSLPPMPDCPKLKFVFMDHKGYQVEKNNIELNCYRKNREIHFSEILSSPNDHDWDGSGSSDSHDEWIEIFNASDLAAELSSWKISDASGKIAKLHGIIQPHQFLVFYFRDTLISLNNGGETLSLFDPSGELIDQIVIPGLKENEAFAEFDDGWAKTNLPTPGALNQKSAIANLELPATENIPTAPSAEVIISNEKTDASDQVIIVHSVVQANLASFISNSNSTLPIVKGVFDQSAEKSAKPFKNLIYLLYFFIVSYVFIATFLLTKITYEIYRRE